MPGDVADTAMQDGRVGGFQRHIGAAAHGDADIGGSERRRVVDAVADLGDDPALTLQLAHDALLVLRQELGAHLDAELRRRWPAAVRRLSPVSMTISTPAAFKRRKAGLRVGTRLVAHGDERRPASPLTSSTETVLPASLSAATCVVLSAFGRRVARAAAWRRAERTSRLAHPPCR